MKNFHKSLLVICTTLIFTPQIANAYVLNGFKWLKDQIPVPYYINENAGVDLGEQIFTIIQESASAWENVTCSYFRTEYKGTTDKKAVPLDKTIVIEWINENWPHGPYVPAATSYGGIGDIAQGDMKLNGQDFTWVKEGGTIFKYQVVDPHAVITHEFGHLFGLSHSDVDNAATMAATYIPGGAQATLTADDKLGLCALYPVDSPVNECETDCDCTQNAECKNFEEAGVNLCDEYRDPVNTTCTEVYINCPEVCLFYDFDYGGQKAYGYCTTRCEKEGTSCDNGWTCKKSTTNIGLDILACANPNTPNPQPVPERTPICDAGVKDTGIIDDGGSTTDAVQTDENPPPSGCECQMDPSSQIPIYSILFFLFLIRFRLRFRFGVIVFALLVALTNNNCGNSNNSMDTTSSDSVSEGTFSDAQTTDGGVVCNGPGVCNGYANNDCDCYWPCEDENMYEVYCINKVTSMDCTCYINAEKQGTCTSEEVSASTCWEKNCCGFPF